MTNDNDLIHLRVAAERKRRAATDAQATQLTLDLGNSYYTDPTPQLHGSPIGVARHSERSEPLCPVCTRYMDQLVDEGYAVRLNPDPVREQTANPIPRHSPFRLHQWIQRHGYPGNLPGPGRHGFRGFITGYLGGTILAGVTDDGRDWAENWGALVRDGVPNPSTTSCTCCPRRNP